MAGADCGSELGYSSDAEDETEVLPSEADKSDGGIMGLAVVDAHTEAARPAIKTAQTGSSSWRLTAPEHGSTTPAVSQTGGGKGSVAAVRFAGRAEIAQNVGARRGHDAETHAERRREKASANRRRPEQQRGTERHREQRSKGRTKRSAAAQQRLPSLGV